MSKPPQAPQQAPELVDSRYGKSRVRLARVKRNAWGNDFQEWTVEILLTGDFASCFEDGDNSAILPTDTMKNTVYSLALDSKAQCIEGFARELAEFLLRRNPQVSAAEVSVEETLWEHLSARLAPHPTTFIQSSAELRTTTFSCGKDAALTIVSGLENLIIMKTADSAFSGFIKDELTTLPESGDRLFASSLWARWKYLEPAVDFIALRARAREALLEVFAEHKSKSVQHTLFAMANRVLEVLPEIEEIELRMPNLHFLPVDLSRFGQDNPNEIFLPIDEPHGYIEARIRRRA